MLKHCHGLQYTLVVGISSVGGSGTTLVFRNGPIDYITLNPPFFCIQYSASCP
ncbi:hypothetical protein M3J09_010205 [Ascochyta lentis]